ncbi:MAG: hypothetical protein LBH87_03305, partial [Coriobacteriales bacterium]|nr:hypothetical protein [Coriobacteriales bacterium]
MSAFNQAELLRILAADLTAAQLSRFDLDILESCDSTNEVLRRRLQLTGQGGSKPPLDQKKQISPNDQFVISSKQTAGKGRLGRHWSSQEGGVYLSVLVREQLDSQAALCLPLLAALASQRA